MYALLLNKNMKIMEISIVPKGYSKLPKETEIYRLCNTELMIIILIKTRQLCEHRQAIMKLGLKIHGQC